MARDDTRPPRTRNLLSSNGKDYPCHARAGEIMIGLSSAEATPHVTTFMSAQGVVSWRPMQGGRSVGMADVLVVYWWRGVVDPFVLAATEAIPFLCTSDGPDHLRERESVPRPGANGDPLPRGKSPELPLEQVSPEVRQLIRRANRLSEFLDWLSSVEPSEGNVLEDDVFPPQG